MTYWFKRRRGGAFRVPVFCYHALHATGPGYAENDHTAMAEDLAALARSGYRLLSPVDLIRGLLDPASFDLSRGRFFCITFDDGPNVDYVDYFDPVVGMAKSFHRILDEFKAASPGFIFDGTQPLAASFLIASEEARTVLDRTCIAGRNDWTSTWWAECASKGIVALGNHSWDHLHETLPVVAQREQRKGSFHAIECFEDADVQVRRAREFIEQVIGGPCSRLFAYPFGHASRYLVEDYFPNHQAEHLHLAAFATGGRPVTEAADRWNIPRYVCGEHWRSVNELEKLLRDL